MRICAVRGRNLASLAGDFEVRFDEPPLSGAGLFAITGPTGAGKSTLLDAMCLALFDSTPRLDGKSRHAVGLADEDEKQRLGTHDVRAILRKGTGEGFAEVEFLGGDGRRYRARWSVQRARKKPEGRPQQQVLSLVDVATGAELGSGRLSEMKELIEAKLGLTFDQFRHSVLLAQGDFAKLLRAPSSERAALLEQMTGTEIYARISVATFERAKREASELAALDERHGAEPPLDDEARAALEAKLTAATAAVATSKQRLEGLRAELLAHITMATLEAEARGAEERLEGALRAHESEASARAVHGEAVRLAPLLAMADRTRAAQADEAAAAEALAATESELATASAELTGARAAHEEARARQVAHEAACAALAPEVVEARRLDQQLATARLQSTDDAQREASARDAHALEEQRAREQARMAHAAREARARLEQEASALAWARRAAAAWAPTRPLVVAATRALVRARAHDGGAPISKGATPAEATAVASSAAAEAEAEERAARDAHEAAKRAVDALGAVDVAVELRALDARAETLRHLTGLVRRAREVEAARAAASARAAALEAERERAQASLHALRDLRPLLARRREDSERAHDAQTAMASMASQRHLLHDGEPCPLCGAEAHPFAELAPAVDELVARARSERDAARGALEAHDREALEREAALGSLEKSLAQAVAERESDAQAMAALHAEWRGALERAGLKRASDPESAEAEVDAAAWLLALEEERRAVEARDGDARAKRADADARRAELDRATGRRAAAALWAEAERSIEALASTFDSERDVRAALLTDADRFTTELEAAVAALQDFDARARTLEADATTAAQEHASCAARVEVLASALVEARAKAAAARAHVDALEGERRRVLAGRSVADVEEESERARQRLSTAAGEAERAIELTQGRASVALAERARRGGVASAAREAAARAHAELMSALADHGVDEARLESARGHDSAWIETERARLDEIESAVRVARAQRDDAAAKRDAHRALMLEARERAHVEAALESEERAHDGAVGDERACREWVAQDEARRASAAAWIDARRAVAARVDTWRALNDLIGSATGTKLREFAQGLTFRGLLEAANSHLAELSPRYRLEPVPGASLELQIVDRDLGDDVRAVTSLSGGETFLVSLALALGLSSLDAGSTRIESLFIDEGFGTLDERTLAVALDVLDALQATGRSVGIITHVSGIEGRLAARVRVESVRGGASRVRVYG